MSIIQDGKGPEPKKKDSGIFRRIDLQDNGVRSTLVLIQAVTRALLAVVVVAIGGYLLISQTPIPHDALPIGYLVLGAYFGLESLAKFLSQIISKP
jgi:hypothetical protein